MIWLVERELFVKYGELHSLISPHSGLVIWDPVPDISKAEPHCQIRIWDTFSKRYLFVNKFVIPETYTVSDALGNKGMEFDLWRTTALLINHLVIFPSQTGSLEKNVFDLVTSKYNIDFRGRFTAHEMAPNLSFYDSNYGGPHSFNHDSDTE